MGSCLRSIATLAVLISFFYVVFSPTAYAYLDLQSGSYIFQMFIGVLLMGFFAIRVYWRKIRASVGDFFRRRQKH